MGDAVIVAGDRNTPTGVGKTTRQAVSDLVDKETPPRAWGRPIRYSMLSCAFRNTPTGVGKTVEEDVTQRIARKHPHGRGEDDLAFRQGMQEAETPPRAWGRLVKQATEIHKGGNTPTGVGKTAIM